VESGEAYSELKGLLIRGRAEVIEDEAKTLEVIKAVHAKYVGSLTPGIEEAMKAQAKKRVVIRVTAERTSSWDHRKLAGAY
jgi:hypothetical protein